MAHIVSIFKAGAPELCNNYRGITLLPVIDKLFMSLLADRILGFAILHDHQYGFVKGKGTHEALFNLIANMQLHKDAKDPLYTFFLDIKKAFDTVNRDMLLAKLHDKGITGKAWRVIRHAYQNTTGRVKLAGQRSAEFNITQGVAQGCPLSPILFIIFMDDMLHKLHTETAGIPITSNNRLAGQNFADDFCGPANTPEQLQNTIDVLAQHSEDWDWTANVQKSVVLIQFLPEQPNRPTFTWQGEDLPEVEKTKYLGVLVNKEATWTAHMKNKIATGNFAVMQHKCFLQSPRYTIRSKLQLARTIILPKITYGMEAYTASTRTDKKTLQELDNTMHKVMYMTLGIWGKPEAWRLRRCIKLDTIYHDMKLLPMKNMMQVAHLRLATKEQPKRKQQTRDGTQDQPPAPNDTVGTTQTIQDALPHSHAWKTMVQEVQHWAEQEERETTPHLANSGGRTTKHVHRSKNHKLNTAARQAHAQQARSQHGDRRLQTSTAKQTAAGRRRSQRLQQQQQEITQATQNETNLWDIYSTIFRQQNEEQQKEAVWTTFTPDIALPLAAIRSGHPLDDLAHGTDSMATLKQGKRHQENWKCARCQHTVYHDGDEGGKASAPWRMIMHTLVHCTQRTCKYPQRRTTANRPESRKKCSPLDLTDMHTSPRDKAMGIYVAGITNLAGLADMDKSTTKGHTEFTQIAEALCAALQVIKKKHNTHDKISDQHCHTLLEFITDTRHSWPASAKVVRYATMLTALMLDCRLPELETAAGTPAIQAALNAEATGKETLPQWMLQATEQDTEDEDSDEDDSQSERADTDSETGQEPQQQTTGGAESDRSAPSPRRTAEQHTTDALTEIHTPTLPTRRNDRDTKALKRQTPDVDTAEQGDEHQQPHPPHTAGASEAESEDEAAMEQLGLTRRTQSVQQETTRRIATEDSPGQGRHMRKQHRESRKRAREECSDPEEDAVLEQPMRPGTRKTSERLKRQREMNGLPNTQLAARKRTRQTSTPPLSRPLGSPSRRLRPMPSG